MTKYNKQDSKIKSGVREFLYMHALSHLPDDKLLNILTLPNTNFELEVRLAHSRRCHVQCCESDVDVYNRAVVPSGIRLYNTNVFELSGHTFDFVWLDYCNSYSDITVNNTLSFLHKNKFADKALFAVTFMKGREQRPITYEQFYPNYKLSGFPKHISPFIGNVKNCRVMQYSCKDLPGRQAPMVLHMFKIQK